MKSLHQAKRCVIVVIGFTILLAGITMIVLPGPAIVAIPAGLAILATEFIWAGRVLKTLSELKKGGNINETK